jgi:hypothetical protein
LRMHHNTRLIAISACALGIVASCAAHPASKDGPLAQQAPLADATIVCAERAIEPRRPAEPARWTATAFATTRQPGFLRVGGSRNGVDTVLGHFFFPESEPSMVSYAARGGYTGTHFRVETAGPAPLSASLKMESLEIEADLVSRDSDPDAKLSWRARYTDATGFTEIAEGRERVVLFLEGDATLLRRLGPLHRCAKEALSSWNATK